MAASRTAALSVTGTVNAVPIPDLAAIRRRASGGLVEHGGLHAFSCSSVGSCASSPKTQRVSLEGSTRLDAPSLALRDNN